MKKNFFTLFAIALTQIANAQTYTVPAASPKQSIEQQFSISTLKLEYSKPAVKGRKIFGELVPFGKVWRAGANSATKLTIEQKIKFGDQIVNPGTYALFIIPEAKQWTLILNKDANAWGSYTYDDKQNIAQTKVLTQNLNSVQEFLNITFEPKDENTTHLVISWDKTKVEVPIQVYDPEATAQIIKLLNEVKQVQRDSNKK